MGKVPDEITTKELANFMGRVDKSLENIDGRFKDIQGVQKETFRKIDESNEVMRDYIRERDKEHQKKIGEIEGEVKELNEFKSSTQTYIKIMSAFIVGAWMWLLGLIGEALSRLTGK